MKTTNPINTNAKSKNVEYIVILPARLKSTRLPEKLLQIIDNKTILEHSYLVAKNSNAKRVVIATDDIKIQQLAISFDAECVLTDTNHQSGTDRIAECCQILQLADDEIIINLQADEPFVPNYFIELCAKSLAENNDCVMSTLACRMQNQTDIDNPNAVKVVLDKRQRAIYFSRASIPYNRDNTDVDLKQNYFHHIGIYGYLAGYLKKYHQLNISPIEQIEKLEQLRVLWNGDKIHVNIVEEKPIKGIDTYQDLLNAQNLYQKMIGQ